MRGKEGLVALAHWLMGSFRACTQLYQEGISHSEMARCLRGFLIAGWMQRGLSTSSIGELAAELGTQQKSIYVVNIEGHRHNGPVLIGLMDDLERRLPHVVRQRT